MINILRPDKDKDNDNDNNNDSDDDNNPSIQSIDLPDRSKGRETGQRSLEGSAKLVRFFGLVLAHQILNNLYPFFDNFPHLFDQVWVHLHVGDHFLNGLLLVGKGSVEEVVADLKKNSFEKNLVLVSDGLLS